MKEYRIMAYFTDIYSPRSYKRKIYKTREEAEKDFPEAEEYYHMLASRMRAKGADVKVVIEERQTTEWTADPKVTLGQAMDRENILPEDITGYFGYLLDTMVTVEDPEEAENFLGARIFLQKVYNLAAKLI